MTTKSSGPVRLRDVAAAAGVNPSIASRILNEDPTLSARPETRRRVRNAARRLGYTPNALARGLKLQRTNTLGLVLPDVANSVNAPLVQGAERRAASHGYVVLLADMDDFARSGDVYRRLILERRVDGLIFSDVLRGHPLMEHLNRNRLPYVLLDCRSAPGAFCVSAEDADGVAIAVEHLVGAGHERIAFLGGPRNRDAAARGLRGYQAAVTRLKLAGCDAFAEVELTEAGGFDGAASLLAARPRPTALVVASLTQSIGAMAAIRRAGLAIPEDVSVIALHDGPLAAYLDPPLTAVSMPLREVAETAVDQVIRMISGETVDDVVVPTPPELIVRGTTAAPLSMA
jgi:LacI family transcriptional regulator, galactose operon repressor